MIDPNMSLKDAAVLDGVKDLPMAVKAKFAQALIAEARGDHATAADKLAVAVASEEKAQPRAA